MPLEDFVAERTAAAKALRKDGDKESAAAVAKLPKPSQVAWVANQLGRAGAGELLAAGDAMREAQLGGGGQTRCGRPPRRTARPSRNCCAPPTTARSRATSRIAFVR